MTTYLRADRALFRFSGEDAHRLVNDVVTGHMPTEPGTANWWALLSPQGKILAEGFAGNDDGALLLDVHQSVADDFFKRMRMYKLRAKVEIEDLRESYRVGFSPETGEKIALGSVELGFRQVSPLDQSAHWVEDDAEYHRARIAAGILHQGNDFPANDAFAHDLGMDILDGIDFVKGCYVGQEVVSRMKHRGTARRRPVIISGVDMSGPISAGGREAGTVGQVVDGRAVAIMRLDRIADPSEVTVDGKPVSISLPGWATYRFGDSTTEE